MSILSHLKKYFYLQIKNTAIHGSIYLVENVRPFIPPSNKDMNDFRYYHHSNL
jgi:hypothetical protein